MISILFPKGMFMDIRYLPNILGENSPGPLQYPFSNHYGCYGSSSSSRPMTLKYGELVTDHSIVPIVWLDHALRLLVLLNPNLTYLFVAKR